MTLVWHDIAKNLAELSVGIKAWEILAFLLQGEEWTPFMNQLSCTVCSRYNIHTYSSSTQQRGNSFRFSELSKGHAALLFASLIELFRMSFTHLHCRLPYSKVRASFNDLIHMFRSLQMLTYLTIPVSQRILPLLSPAQCRLPAMLLRKSHTFSFNGHGHGYCWSR